MEPSENSWWWKLPADIQADILSRSQGNDLLKLKLVSWGWYHVISYICIPRLAPPSPEASFCGIIYIHRQRDQVGTVSPHKLDLASCRRRSNFEVRNLSITERVRRDCKAEDIQDCCNGILLAVNHQENGCVCYRLYNPTTGERIQVPSPPHSYYSHHNRTTQCCFASLAFEPTKSLHYKIICTLGGNITNPLKVETFSSEIGKWFGYVVNIDSEIDGVEWIHRSAYLDGRVYRLLKTNYLACIHEVKSSELLRVRAIELPYFCGDSVCMDDSYYGSIGISRGHMYYSNREKNGSTLLVYMLIDDVSWILKHTIVIGDLSGSPSSMFPQLYKRIVKEHGRETWFNFHAFHPNCDSLFLKTPYHILRYCPEEKYLQVLVGAFPGREIAVDQNNSFTYSHCPIVLQNADFLCKS